MKIKHWQGYGTVDAKKINEQVSGDRALVEIKVTGNHEWGIERDDKYDVTNWLLKKLVKGFKNEIYDYRDIVYMSLEPGYEKDDKGQMVDTCIYSVIYEV